MAYLGFKGLVGGLVFASLAAFSAPSAFAQDSGAGGAPPAAGDQQAWVKQCATDQKTNNKICVVSQITALSREVIPSVSIRPSSDKKYIVAMLVPVGVLIPPGVALAVDKNKLATAQYVSCDVPGPNFQFPVPACAAQAEVDDSFLAAMRKGNELELVVVDQRNQPLPIPLTLIGFAKVYDGPGVDAQTAQKQVDDRIKGLTDESRKSLIDKLKQLQDKQAQ
jgi:invasion protein IalB